MSRRLLLSMMLAVTAFAQKYDGPRPPKPDMLYLRHAAELIPTEVQVAQEESKKKDDVTYVIAGANSSVVTPLASPVFILQADKINADRIALYKLESKNGRREIRFTRRKPAPPIRLDVTRYTSDRIWKIEVDESLEPGEYSLTQDAGEGEKLPQSEANKVWCFRVR